MWVWWGRGGHSWRCSALHSWVNLLGVTMMLMMMMMKVSQPAEPSLAAGTKHEIATFICSKSKDLRRRTQDIPQFGSSPPRSHYSLITNFKWIWKYTLNRLHWDTMDRDPSVKLKALLIQWHKDGWSWSHCQCLLEGILMNNADCYESAAGSNTLLSTAEAAVCSCIYWLKESVWWWSIFLLLWTKSHKKPKTSSERISWHVLYYICFPCAIELHYCLKTILKNTTGSHCCSFITINTHTVVYSLEHQINPLLKAVPKCTISSFLFVKATVWSCLRTWMNLVWTLKVRTNELRAEFHWQEVTKCWQTDLSLVLLLSWDL